MPQKSITSSTAVALGSLGPESANDGNVSSTAQASSNGTPCIARGDKKVQEEDLKGLGSQFSNEWPMEPSRL